jgi:hypothetical protein
MLNSVQPNGIPLCSGTLRCMQHTLNLVDLMMVASRPKHVVLLNLYMTPLYSGLNIVVFDGTLKKLTLV